MEQQKSWYVAESNNGAPFDQPLPLDDDHIETAIEVRFLGMDVETNASPSPSAPVLDVNNETDRHHGISYDGSIASCGRVNPGLTDCQSCLAEATDIFSSTLSEADASVVHQLLTALQEAGGKGLARPVCPGIVML